MSYVNPVIEVMVKKGIIQWVLRILDKTKHLEMNSFTLEFSTALLVNILLSQQTIETLTKQTELAKTIITTLMSFLKEKLSYIVLLHMLLCLVELSKEAFAILHEELAFADKINDFAEFYSQINVTCNIHHQS
jgi:hypothetical protein